MAYYCLQCDQMHDSWPFLQFIYPQDCLNLLESRKKVELIEMDHGYKIEYPGFTKYYTHVCWDQLIATTGIEMHFIVWVNVVDLKDIDDLCNSKINYCDVKLQSNFPWYSNIFLDLPVRLRYNFFDNEIYVDKILKRKSRVFKDFNNGLPPEVAYVWMPEIVNYKNWSCMM